MARLVKFKRPAVEKDCYAVVFEGPKAAGAGLDRLNLRVESLGHSVGDSMGDVVEQAWEMVMHRHRDLRNRPPRGYLGLLQRFREKGAGDLTPANWAIADESLGSEKETQTCQKERSTRRSRSSRSCAGWRAARRRKPSAGA